MAGGRGRPVLPLAVLDPRQLVVDTPVLAVRGAQQRLVRPVLWVGGHRFSLGVSLLVAPGAPGREDRLTDDL